MSSDASDLRTQTGEPHEEPSAAAQAQAVPLPPTISDEQDRAKLRRSTMQIPRPEAHRQAEWALAFSGGGIRSATFCLGVLQGLAKAAPPVPQAGVVNGPPKNSAESLLPQFDYVSTVSGGGYCGSFFGSLFADCRLNPQKQLNDRDLAIQAYKVFEAEPPGRLRSNVMFNAQEPGEGPLAWLRENGRYMAPSGSGDLVYAVALTIRNWFAVHYVIGTALLTAFALIAVTRGLLFDWLPEFPGGWSYREFEYQQLKDVVEVEEFVIWWSPIWWLLLPLFGLWLIPAALAFWLTQPPPGGSVSDPSKWSTLAPMATALSGLILFGLGVCGGYLLDAQWLRVILALEMAGLLAMLGSLWHYQTTYNAYGPAMITDQRVTLTRALANGLLCLLAIVLLAAVDTASQSLYANLYQAQGWLSSTAVIGAIVWLARHFATAFAEKEREGWLSKIPLGAIISVAGVALLFLVALFWAMLLQWVQWQGSEPYLELLSNAAAHREMLAVLLITAGLAFGLTWLSSQFPGFLNLSTLQGLYSARLTRAYLGASNGVRFMTANAGFRSVAEPIPGDQVSHDEYYKNALMPIHIINVCVNQNNDPGEQLVQRDRKGKPLAILPGGFSLDGEFCNFPPTAKRGELYEELTIGEWVGVSGAAFSTGLGRRTTLGYSLLMGLANVRLGRWWRSGLGKYSDDLDDFSRHIRRAFKTHAYLSDELFASFYGTRRPLQYLSDGGHFENTAVYELLRPGRNVRLIVLCDCGCDPKYEFEDVANLIRLVRIDFGIEIEVDRDIARENPAIPMEDRLDQVFGTPEEFHAITGDDSTGDLRAADVSKCALLLKVYLPRPEEPGRRDLISHIVVLKPHLLSSSALDLRQYHSTNPDFPQQPTADQFYDEAQWESYRRLGLETAARVFGVGPESANYRRKLWEQLLV